MGIALQNARLFGRLSKRGAELQEINTKLEEELAERRKVQAELEKAMELAKAAAIAKDQFLASVSHEIRTPLNAIIGMTGLLLDTQLTETQHEWLHLIDLSGNALLSLVNDILDLAKMESGRASLVMEDFALADVMREATAMFVHASQTKGIRMSLRLDPTCPETIHTDKLRLRQVLLHLLSNAIKFTPPDGSVTLSVAARRVNVVESEEPVVDNNSTTNSRQLVDDPVNGQWDEVQVNVRDTGPGVDGRMVDRLFQRFTLGDASFSRKTGGTGLGLAISKQLVGLLGGQIWLDRSVTDGSSFHFTIVCRRVTTPPPPPRSEQHFLSTVRAPASPSSAYAAATALFAPTASDSACIQFPSILVVEDNKANQKLLMMLLQRMGYAADVAGDGLQAVEAWHKKKYAVILMDLQMPNRDGLLASRVIMSECDGAQPAPQIIAISANVYASDKAACLAAGMVDLIEKPISRQLLKAALERCTQTTQPEISHEKDQHQWRPKRCRDDVQIM
jgi:signal transduction histidine kinase/FixJ family two-component response regulator